MKRTVIVTLALLFCISLTADPINLKTLQQRIQQLEQRVQRLEQLLTNRSATKTPSNIPAGKEAWRKLRRGMTPDQVRALLGRPDLVRATVIFTYWYYKNGEVFFSEDGVKGWEEKSTDNY